MHAVFPRDGCLDREGVFIEDGSYLFVPNSPAYENSVVLCFVEHHPPVEYEKLNAAERRKAHPERCDKLANLLHLRAGADVYAAPAVVPGNTHEEPNLHEPVEGIAGQVTGRANTGQLTCPASGPQASRGPAGRPRFVSALPPVPESPGLIHLELEGKPAARMG